MKRVVLDDQQIQAALLPYDVSADHDLCNDIRIYTETLLRWNEKISLTTVTDPTEILRLHFGESFFAASVSGIANGRVADIGTGAGFPGIPMRMVRRGLDLTLVEPIAKRTAFLGEVLRNLTISDATIIRCRMEELPTEASCFDLIVARALGRYDRLLRWSETRISRNGSIMLLLGESDTEHISKDQNWVWCQPKRIPQSKGRFILIGSLQTMKS